MSGYPSLCPRPSDRNRQSRDCMPTFQIHLRIAQQEYPNFSRALDFRARHSLSLNQRETASNDTKIYIDEGPRIDGFLCPYQIHCMVKNDGRKHPSTPPRLTAEDVRKCGVQGNLCHGSQTSRPNSRALASETRQFGSLPDDNVSREIRVRQPLPSLLPAMNDS